MNMNNEIQGSLSDIENDILLEEIEHDLVGLMKALGISRIDAMTFLATIKAERIQLEMNDWVASFKDRPEELTSEAFTNKCLSYCHMDY